jgi:hypothetical protein
MLVRTNILLLYNIMNQAHRQSESPDISLPGRVFFVKPRKYQKVGLRDEFLHENKLPLSSASNQPHEVIDLMISHPDLTSTPYTVWHLHRTLSVLMMTLVAKTLILLGFLIDRFDANDGQGASTIQRVLRGGNWREEMLWQLGEIVLSRSMLKHHELCSYIETLDRC